MIGRKNSPKALLTRALCSLAAGTLVLTLVLPSPLLAFLIPRHRNITTRALERIPRTALLAEWERRELIDGSGDTDLSEGGLWPPGEAPYEPRFHFDRNDNYAAVRRNFQDLMRLVHENLAKVEKDPHEFGKILHAVEDFYSHSNYVTLYRQFRTERNELVGGIPLIEDVLLNPDLYPGFQTILTESLQTGWYPDHNPTEDMDHGSAINPYGRGMNKDTFLRSFNTDAKVTAETAAAWYVRLYLKDPDVVQRCETAWHATILP
jgi:hypothetical protein